MNPLLPPMQISYLDDPLPEAFCMHRVVHPTRHKNFAATYFQGKRETAHAREAGQSLTLSTGSETNKVSGHISLKLPKLTHSTSPEGAQ